MEKILEKISEKYRGSSVNIILLLHDIQSEFGYIPEDVVYWFSRKLDIPASRFFGIATFYGQFHLTPKGKHTVTVCCGAACHIKGGDKIYETAREILKLPEGEHTTEDRLFSLQKATCIGACSVAPVVLLNETVFRNMDSEKISKLLTDYGKEEEIFGY